MKRQLLLLFLTIICMSLSYGQNEADTTEQTLMMAGNAAYQNENYSLAVDYYKQLVENGYESADLYYNLGNAYYKNRNNAQALLWYERALRLSPADEDIRHNIAFVNQRITDKIDAVPQSTIARWWNQLAHTHNEKQWAVLSIICGIILLTSITLFLFSRKNLLRTIGFIFIWISIIILILSIIFANKEKQRMTSQNEAIMTDLVVEAKNEPNISGTTLFVIHEGLKVEIGAKMNGWVEIKIPNGEKGWVLENTLEVI